MREIKFRYTYKRKSDGKIWQEINWIEGIEEGKTLVMKNNELWELLARDQFTGLTDKNGVDIYEGDIVEYVYLAATEEEKKQAIGEIIFENGEFIIRDFSLNLSLWDIIIYWQKPDWERIEVIGNVWENPELLNGEKC